MIMRANPWPDPCSTLGQGGVAPRGGITLPP
ncbi:hypothetical protein [Bacteriophage sp.]|nr:hypothetical protein [Bacteriophage sp.]UOF80112.1 hypothetical protein [Bacteriophage sp.]